MYKIPMSALSLYFCSLLPFFLLQCIFRNVNCQCFHPYSGNLRTIILSVLLLIAGMGLAKNVISLGFHESICGLEFFVCLFLKLTDNICCSLHTLLLKFT